MVGSHLSYKRVASFVRRRGGFIKSNIRQALIVTISHKRTRVDIVFRLFWVLPTANFDKYELPYNKSSPILPSKE